MPPRQAEPSYANPLLVRFLEDFWRAAQDNNFKMADTYKRALKSLKECPVVFQHPSECKILHGFGPKLCEELTRELAAYNRHKGLPPPVIPKAHEVRQRVQQFEQYKEDQARRRMDRQHVQRTQKLYVPEPRTGGWAILRALYEVDDSRGALTKDQIIARAQKWCDASFTIPPNPARPYTAWNSIETQKNHGYVRERKRGNETVYELTDAGLRTAHEIDENERNPDGPANVEQLDNDVVAISAVTAIGERRLWGAGPRTPASASSGISGRRPEPEIISLDDDDDENDDDYNMISRGFNTPVASSAALPSRIVTTGSSSGRNNNAAVASRTSGSLQNPLPAALPISNHGSLFSRSPAASTPTARTPSARASAARSEPPATPALLSIPLPAPLPAPEFPDLDLNSIITFNPPGVYGAVATYMVQLIVDSREVRTIEDRQYFAKYLPDNGVIPEQRTLNVGDFLWVARSREARLVLDHVVERKRFDDLLSSLIDNRFQDQKARLKLSCVENVIYLIEDFQMPALDPETQQKVDGAIAATITVDGFFVKNTKDITKTVAYIAALTRRIEERWRERRIAQIPSRLIDPKTLPQLKAWLAERYPEYYWCLSLDDYNMVGKKDRAAKETGKQAYCKMLMCAKGISAEKANEVFRIYPTPRDLIEAWEKCTSQEERDRLLADATRAQIGAKKIPSSVSRKVKEIWWGEG
ncbi:hypothetical protein BZA77DRAFT_263411, partial [Pyronema omphalodes]